MRIVAISDTHFYPLALPVPDGDVLIHAGDLTMWGKPKELAAAADWLDSLPHKHKIVIAGNHDFGLVHPDQARVFAAAAGAHYLQDSGVEVEGKLFWGTPWVTNLPAWAFNQDSLKKRAAHFSKIPEGLDVLISHAPPRMVLDNIPGVGGVGDYLLFEAATRLQPKLHIFGHIHEGYGQEQHEHTLFVNAALCNEGYKQVNPPWVLEL